MRIRRAVRATVVLTTVLLACSSGLATAAGPGDGPPVRPAPAARPAVDAARAVGTIRRPGAVPPVDATVVTVRRAGPVEGRPSADRTRGLADAAGCPGQGVPPGPPADEEAVPVPPLPVPAEPVGGPGMGACGDVRAAGTAVPPPVGLASYVVADLDSGAVLAARAPHARHRPASTLKLLTVLVATERLNPSAVVVGTPEDADVDGSRAGVGPGGRYTVQQLLAGLLLVSGNDTASALARTIGGVPATLAAMQEKARSLGALDTRPVTPSGLDGPGMASSAYDLALFFRAAVARPQIVELLRTRTVPFPGFADKPGFLISNGDPLLDDPGVIGGKTGFTDSARHTFVGAVDRGGRRLVVVLVRGEQRPVRMVDQARALLDWGFATPRTAAPVGELVEPAEAPAAETATPAAGPPAEPTGTPPVAVLLGGVALITVLALLVLRRRRP